MTLWLTMTVITALTALSISVDSRRRLHLPQNRDPTFWQGLLRSDYGRRPIDSTPTRIFNTERVQ